MMRAMAELIGGVEQLSPRLGFPKALVVPHAGYIYSGLIAGSSFQSVAHLAGRITRVALIGLSGGRLGFRFTHRTSPYATHQPVTAVIDVMTAPRSSFRSTACR